MISASDGCVVDLRIATPAALLAMPITVCGHASIASSAVDVEIIVHGSAMLAPLEEVPLTSPPSVVPGTEDAAGALVHRRAGPAELAIVVR